MRNKNCDMAAVIKVQAPYTREDMREAHAAGWKACLEHYRIPSLTRLEDAGDQRHYMDSQGVEAIDFILSNGMNFCEGCVVKYLARWHKKGGIEDLKKAQQYLLWLIEAAEQETAE